MSVLAAEYAARHGLDRDSTRRHMNKATVQLERDQVVRRWDITIASEHRSEHSDAAAVRRVRCVSLPDLTSISEGNIEVVTTDAARTPSTAGPRSLVWAN